MNGNLEKSQDAYRSYLLLAEIAKDQSLSQRELASRIGVALGLVNSYLKNLAAKGFVRVKAFPRNRYAYLLTPKGIAEKSRLTYQHLNYFTSLYTLARQDYLDLFRALKAQGVMRVAFCGVDEVAEIAFLSLQEADMELAVVMDEEGQRIDLFGHPVLTLAEGVVFGCDRIVVTSLKRRELLCQKLKHLMVSDENICVAGGVD